MNPNFISDYLPTLNRALQQLQHILLKAEAHAESLDIPQSVFSGDRLYPDMFPLTLQVFIACDITKGAFARLANVEPPSFPDEEVTFAELRERVQKTLDYISSFDKNQFEGAAERPIVLKLKTRTLEFVGQDYLFKFVIPNVYFHITTCYNILRHNGVPLGKADFLGEL